MEEKRHHMSVSQSHVQLLKAKGLALMEQEDLDDYQDLHHEHEDAFEIVLEDKKTGYDAFSTLLELSLQSRWASIQKKLEADDWQDLRINQEDTWGMTPVSYAAKAGNLDLVRMLVERGARIVTNPAKNRKSLSPSISARSLPRRAYAASQNGVNVLMFAAESGNLALVQYLLDEHRADVHARDPVNRTVLHYAAKGGNLDMLRLLLHKFKDDDGSQYGQAKEPVQQLDMMERSLLMFAALSGKRRVVDFCLEQKLDPKAVDVEGRTVLMYAVEGGDYDIVRDLIDTYGLDPKARTVYEKSVLSFAAQCSHDNVKVMEYLIRQHGASLSDRDMMGRSPFFFACQGGAVSNVDFLILRPECDQDEPYRTDEYGRTPLSYACESGNLLVVEYLIEQLECDPTILEEHESNTEQFSFWGQRSTVWYAMKGGNLAVATYLIELTGKRKIDLNVLDDERGESVAHFAARNTLWGMVRLMVNNGADPNLPDQGPSSKKTLLMYACLDSNVEVMKWLILRADADPSMEDMFGHSLPNYYLFRFWYKEPPANETVEEMVARQKREQNMRQAVGYEFLSSIDLSQWEQLKPSDRRSMIRVIERDPEAFLTAMRDSVATSDFGLRRCLELYELLDALSQQSSAVGPQLAEYAQQLQGVAYEIYKDSSRSAIDQGFSPAYLLEGPGDDGRSVLELILDSHNAQLASHPDLVQTMDSIWQNTPPPGTYVDQNYYPKTIAGKEWNFGDPQSPGYLIYYYPFHLVRTPRFKFIFEALSYVYMVIIVSAMAFDRIRLDEKIRTIELLVFVQGIALALNEFLQMSQQGLFSYLSTGWNMFDFIMMICIGLLALVRGRPDWFFGWPDLTTSIATTDYVVTMTTTVVDNVYQGTTHGNETVPVDAVNLIDENNLPFFIYVSVISMLSVMVWLRLLYVLSMSATMGPLLVSVQRMRTDITRFIGLLFLFCAGFFFAMVFVTETTDAQANSGTNNEFSGVKGLLLTLSYMSITAEPSEHFSSLNPARRIWVETLLFIFLFLTGIVLVNLLIAMMASTYEDVEAVARLEAFYEQLAIIYEYDRSLNVLPPPLNLVVVALLPWFWLVVYPGASLLEWIKHRNKETIDPKLAASATSAVERRRSKAVQEDDAADFVLDGASLRDRSLDHQHCPYCHEAFSGAVDRLVEEHNITTRKLVEQGLMCSCGRARRELPEPVYFVERASGWLFFVLYLGVMFVLVIWYFIRWYAFSETCGRYEARRKAYKASKVDPYRLRLTPEVMKASAIQEDKKPYMKKELTMDDLLNPMQLQKLHKEVGQKVENTDRKFGELESKVASLAESLRTLRSDIALQQLDDM